MSSHTSSAAGGAETTKIIRLAAHCAARRLLINRLSTPDGPLTEQLDAEARDFLKMADLRAASGADLAAKASTLRAGTWFRHGMADGPEPAEKRLLDSIFADIERL
jgi:hypothetical protein